MHLSIFLSAGSSSWEVEEGILGEDFYEDMMMHIGAVDFLLLHHLDHTQIGDIGGSRRSQKFDEFLEHIWTLICPNCGLHKWWMPERSSQTWKEQIKKRSGAHGARSSGPSSWYQENFWNDNIRKNLTIIHIWMDLSMILDNSNCQTDIH